MRPPIHVTSIAITTTLLLGSCADLRTAQAERPATLRVSLEDLEIDGGYIRSLEAKNIVIIGKIEETEYGTLALYPRGKGSTVEDAGTCIDLVYRRDDERAVAAAKGRVAYIAGHIVMLNSLPMYTVAVDIDGIRHTPVCQIFSNTAPYPYFVVSELHAVR